MCTVYKNPYNNCCHVSFSVSEYTKIDVSWGFAPDTLGELTALLLRPQLVSRGPFRGRRGMEGREGLEEGKRGRKGKGGMGKGEEKEDVGGE